MSDTDGTRESERKKLSVYVYVWTGMHGICEGVRRLCSEYITLTIPALYSMYTMYVKSLYVCIVYPDDLQCLNLKYKTENTMCKSILLLLGRNLIYIYIY